MLVQLRDFGEVHRLHTNRTTNQEARASVRVDQNGTYQVNIFAMSGESGIIGSNVEYTKEVTITITDGAILNSEAIIILFRGTPKCGHSWDSEGVS